jgi:phage-related protein
MHCTSPSAEANTATRKHWKTGRQTPRRDVELIKQRLRETEQIEKEMKP